MRFSSLAGLVLLATPAVAEAPDVAVDIAPVHALVSQVMQGVGTPDLIVQTSGSPHGMSLRPSQARMLQRADLVVWIGPELTPWLEKPIATLAEDTATLRLLDAGSTYQLSFRDWQDADHDAGHEEAGHDDAAGHDDHDEDEHGHDETGHDDDHGEDEGHGHDHDGVDPHAWLDPQNAQIWLALIAEKLAQLDAENAEQYRANAAQASAELDALSEDIKTRLAPVAAKPFVTFHDAFQYFEARFGLISVGAVTLSDAADASPARLAALRDRLAAAGVQCAFSEPGFDTGVLEGIAGTDGLRIAILDPMAREVPHGSGLYATMLRDISINFAACMQSEN